MIRGWIAVLGTAVAFGQAAAPPAFDVASVRASAGNQRREPFGSPVQVSPDGVTIRNASLRTVTRWAYHVMEYQVNGPDWINNERYDITAKAAGAVSEDQLRLMMQTLLAERFKMVTHRQTKEMQAYVLLVAKGGPKFKEASSQGEMDVKPDQSKLTVSVQRAPLSQLVDMLSALFRMPVVDQTELTGKYDITINLAKYIADFGPRAPGSVEAPPDPLAIVTRGLQEELGLKMESKKLALDLVIVDKAEKAPVEN